MLIFHNDTAKLANLYVSFSRKDAKFAKEAPRISRIDTYLFNLTTDYGQQTSDCLKDEIKNPHQYVRFVESLLRILRLCERVLRADSRDTWRNLRDLRRRFRMLFLTLGIFPLTGTVNTSYRYYQYQLPVLPIPLTGTTSTKKRKKIDTSFELFKALISYLFKTLKSLKNKA